MVLISVVLLEETFFFFVVANVFLPAVLHREPIRKKKTLLYCGNGLYLLSVNLLFARIAENALALERKKTGQDFNMEKWKNHSLLKTIFIFT